MAKGKKKLDSKSFAQQKRHRRQWVTFMRMLRYGVNNFTRNAWLTIAATAVMTITLFVIFTSFTARNVLIDTLTDVRDKVQMSIYLKTDTPGEDVTKVVSDVSKLPSVQSVNTISPDDARKKFIDQNKDQGSLNAIKEATNSFPWTLSIKVKDINDTTQLASFVNDNTYAKSRLDPAHAPSFAGSKKATIETIARAVDFAQKVGIGASIIFVLISTLIIFNTIRMAIFNRREEIQMMKLIGAERSFIRGPFIVEAMVYGFFAALIASGLGYGILYLAAPSLQSYAINIQPTIDMLTFYSGFVLLGMILIGFLIGIISSLMATRRYLKL
ncbi:MAG: permease-like cell division protein FtsX [Candidatus Saccharimonadales bacterium]